MGKSAKSVKKAKMELKEKQKMITQNKEERKELGKRNVNKGNVTPKKKYPNQNSLETKQKNRVNVSTPKQKGSSNVSKGKEKNFDIKAKEKIERKPLNGNQPLKKEKTQNFSLPTIKKEENKELQKISAPVEKVASSKPVSPALEERKAHINPIKQEEKVEINKPVGSAKKEVKKVEQQNTSKSSFSSKDIVKDNLPKSVERKSISKTTLGTEPVKKNGQVVGQVKKKGASVKNVGISHTTQMPTDKVGGSFELPKKKSTVSAEDSMLKLVNELKVENQKKKQKTNASKKKDTSLDTTNAIKKKDTSLDTNFTKKKDFTKENKKSREEKELLKDIVSSIQEESVAKKETTNEKKLTKREEKYAYQAELAAKEGQKEDKQKEETRLKETIIPVEEIEPIMEEEENRSLTQENREDASAYLEDTNAFQIPSSIEEESKEEETPEIEFVSEKEKTQVTKKEKKKKEKKRLTKVGWVFKILAWIAFLFFLASTVHLFIRVVQINLLPMKYIYIAIGILSFLSLLMLFFAISRKKLLHFLQIIITIVLGSVFTFGALFIMKSDASLKSLFSEEEDLTTYYVVSLKETDYSSLASLEDQTVGIMKQNSTKVKETLENYKFVYKEYDAVGALTSSLLSETEEQSKALVIDSNVYDALPEIDNALYEQIQVIYEFEIHVEKEDVNLEVEDTTIEENPENEEVYQGPKRNPNLLDGLNIGNSYIVYISGIDGGGYARPYGLSDVNILVVVNPDTHKILLVSTPRDYFVQVAGTTGLKDKITHAGLYGINASIGTMQNLYGLKINNYVKVTFGAIQTLVDDIGGIEVYSDTAFYSSHKKGWYVEKGTNYMDGAKALAYSRERYAYAGGDRHRIKNQQDVISAIIKKVATDPQQLLKFNTILNDINPYFATDISYDRMQQMVKEQLNTLRPWSVSSVSVNGTNGSSATASWPNQITYVMYPTESTIVDAQAKIVEVMTGS